MITKRELFEICMSLFDNIDKIEERLDKIEKELKTNTKTKRKPGRPRKEA